LEPDATLPPPTDLPGIDPIQNDMDLRLSFTGMPTGSELSDKKAKSGDEISPYGCFLNAYQPDESEPYRYWSVYLHYPEQIIEEAGDRKAVYKYRLKEDSDKVYLLANCVIPATQNAANLVDRLLRESLSEYESSSTVAKSNIAPQPLNTSDDWCSQPNNEGFSCMEGTCWLNGDMNTCCGPDGCGLPEVEVVEEIEDCLGDDCGGGSGLPWPIPPAPPEDPSDPNPWEPIIPGGSSDPCETCDPGEDPDDNEETCPLGQIDDGFGNCIDEEDPEPCVETGDSFLDDSFFQNKLQEAATESGLDELNEDNKIEGFYAIRLENGVFSKEPIPHSGRTSCSYDISTTSSFFDDVVALIHTHPYAPYQEIRDQACLERKGWDVESDGFPIYNPGPSDADRLVASITSLPLYTIDSEKIYVSVKDESGQIETETKNRCGF